jgi:hypothetical protein
MAGAQPIVDAMLPRPQWIAPSRSTNSIDGAARADAIATDCQPRSSVPVACPNGVGEAGGARGRFPTAFATIHVHLGE